MSSLRFFSCCCLGAPAPLRLWTSSCLWRVALCGRSSTCSPRPPPGPHVDPLGGCVPRMRLPRLHNARAFPPRTNDGRGLSRFHWLCPPGLAKGRPPCPLETAPPQYKADRGHTGSPTAGYRRHEVVPRSRASGHPRGAPRRMSTRNQYLKAMNVYAERSTLSA